MFTNIPSDVSQRFNSRIYSAILKGITATDVEQLSCLESFSEMLVFATPSQINRMPMNEFCIALIKCLQQNPTVPAVGLATQCIRSVITICPASLSLFIQNRLIPQIVQILDSNPSQTTFENCIQIAGSFAGNFPDEFNTFFGITRLIKSISSLNKPDQRQVFGFIYFQLSTKVFEQDVHAIPDMVSYLSDTDATIRHQASECFFLIVKQVPPKSLPDLVFSPIFNVLLTTADTQLASDLLSAIEKALSNKSLAAHLLSNPPSFQALLFSPAAQKSKDVTHAILEIVKVLLPPPKLPSSLWSRRQHHIPHSEQFAINVLPDLVECLISRNTCETNLITLIAACASFRPIVPSRRFIDVLVRHAHSSKSAPFILFIASCFKNRTDVSRSGLLTILQTKTSSEWYRETMRSLSESITAQIPSNVAFSQQLAEVVKYITDSDVFPYEFMHSPLFDKVLTMLKAGCGVKLDLSPLVELGYGMLSFIPYPTQKDPLKLLSPTKFAQKGIAVRVINPRGSSNQITLNLASDLMSLEGWYNLEFNRRCVRSLTKASFGAPNLLKLITMENDVVQKPELFALLCRAFEVPDYQKCSFTIEGKKFSAYDDLLPCLASTMPVASLGRARIDITVSEEETQKTEFRVSKFECNEMSKPLELLSQIWKVCNYSLNDRYCQEILSHLNYPVLTIGHYSPYLSFVYSFPFLFNFDERVFVFRAANLDPTFSLVYMRQYFNISEDEPLPSIHLHCEVERSSLFEQGLEIFRRFGSGSLRLDFTFSGEKGFGDGPTQEFYSEFSKGFCLKSNNIWRDEGDGLYAKSASGLFPKPFASPDIFEAMGIFTSKAISLGMTLELPLSSAFIRRLRGEKVDLSDVDPILSRSLECKEGLIGLSFVMPGKDGTELKENGAEVLVEESNVDEYVNLVKEMSVGSGVEKAVAAFIKGFNSNISFSSLSIFSAEEVCCLISGQDTDVSESDLKRYVVLEHGYDSKSPEIATFFSVVLGMSPEEKRLFFRFVTGCSRLPVGGLAGLNPPLTVARRVSEGGQPAEDYLPSVMTCTNYFKLPPYSDRDTMRAKILQAIHECQDLFLLS